MKGRTFDGATGEHLPGVRPAPSARHVGTLGQTSSSATAGTTAVATVPAGTPTEVIAVVPQGSVSALAAIPWWLWLALGIGAGYLIARNYGHRISRQLSNAARIANPR